MAKPSGSPSTHETTSFGKPARAAGRKGKIALHRPGHVEHAEHPARRTPGGGPGKSSVYPAKTKP